jgi:hypothetical protein
MRYYKNVHSSTTHKYRNPGNTHDREMDRTIFFIYTKDYFTTVEK